MTNLQNQLDEFGVRSAELGVSDQAKQTLNIEAILFNEAEEIKRFRDYLFSSILTLVEDAGSLAIANLGLTMNFNLLDPNVMNMIEGELFHTIRGINQTTANKLRNTLLEAITEGESPQQITKRIQEVFKGTVRGTAPRSRLIARTETTKFFNNGTLQSWQQTGIVLTKIWYTALDERVRETHRSAHNQEVPINGVFTVGGFQLEHPGDAQASAAEVVNCRCAMLPGKLQE